MKWISQALPKARRVASVCLGAFALAWTGVLDGKRAATHWRYCPRLQDSFPNIRVEPNAIFVKDGRVWSSAGVSAGIDLALAMIEEDFGHTTALDVARRLVVFLKRPGGQSQFSTVLAAQASDVEGRFSALHAWIIENIASDLRVETLAEKAGMTPRTFARTYASRTGMTPASGVEALRVETARLLLESRQIGGVVEVAQTCRFRRRRTDATGLPAASRRIALGVQKSLFGRLNGWCHPRRPRKSLVLVLKMRRALPFLATIQIDACAMKTLAVISLLALLTISGAAYTDQLFTGDQRTTQGAN